MNRIEDIVYYDFQGWPEYKMNLREVLMALGGKVEGNTISFDLKDPLMDVYPRILVDDGMGYGVDENVIVSVDPDRQKGFINIFREKKPTDEQQAELARQADSHMSMEKLEAFHRLEALLDKKRSKGKMVVFIDELPWLDTPRANTCVVRRLTSVRVKRYVNCLTDYTDHTDKYW